MKITQDIKDILYSTIHENKKSVKQIADEIGISTNYLYRACLPEDESGVKFPVQFLLPLMKSTNNYSLLKHIAQLAGFIIVKIPRFKSKKTDEMDIMEEYQRATIKALESLRQFFENPNSTNYNILDKHLLEVMEKSVSAKKYSGKKLIGQIEMELGNDTY